MEQSDSCKKCKQTIFKLHSGTVDSYKKCKKAIFKLHIGPIDSCKNAKKNIFKLHPPNVSNCGSTAFSWLPNIIPTVYEHCLLQSEASLYLSWNEPPGNKKCNFETLPSHFPLPLSCRANLFDPPPPAFHVTLCRSSGNFVSRMTPKKCNLENLCLADPPSCRARVYLTLLEGLLCGR